MGGIFLLNAEGSRLNAVPTRKVFA